MSGDIDTIIGSPEGEVISSSSASPTELEILYYQRQTHERRRKRHFQLDVCTYDNVNNFGVAKRIPVND